MSDIEPRGLQTGLTLLDLTAIYMSPYSTLLPMQWGQSPYHPHRTTDGLVSVMPYTDGHWRLLCSLFDDGMLDDPRFPNRSPVFPL